MLRATRVWTLSTRLNSRARRAVASFPPGGGPKKLLNRSSISGAMLLGRGLSPRFAKRVRLGVEDHLVEVEGPRVEEQIQVLERLGEEEAVHEVTLLLRDHVFEDGI